MVMVGLSESRWTIIFTDDVVICGETRELEVEVGFCPVKDRNED